MEKVYFKFKNGHVRTMAKRQAEILGKLGHGTYQTRDMAAQPMVTKLMQAAPVPVALTDPEPDEAEDDDGLDAMDKDELHALAKARGVKVHHLAGADKVRAALREDE
jgi:hypothetical protein